MDLQFRHMLSLSLVSKEKLAQMNYDQAEFDEVRAAYKNCKHTGGIDEWIS